MRGEKRWYHGEDMGECTLSATLSYNLQEYYDIIWSKSRVFTMKQNKKIGGKESGF